MKKRVRVKIFGEVIGVGFRAFIKREAGKLGVFGWVRNVGRKYVEAVFEGEEVRVDEMTEICKKGVGTYIEKIEVKDENFNDDYKSFEIII